MNKIELTALKINTGKETIELTIAEAKALYRQLHELFGERVIRMPAAPVVINQPPWWPDYPKLPSAPQWIETPRTGDPLPAFPTITCQARLYESASNQQ